MEDGLFATSLEIDYSYSMIKGFLSLIFWEHKHIFYAICKWYQLIRSVIMVWYNRFKTSWIIIEIFDPFGMKTLPYECTRSYIVDSGRKYVTLH